MILSYRLSVAQLDDDKAFGILLAFVKKYRDIIDEMSLFTEYWHHGYFPLDRFAGRAETLGKRIRQFREAGFPIMGINMLDTTGHLDEAWDFLPKLPYQAMIGHDGTVSTFGFCANTPKFSSYISEKYRLIAEQKPDFIWVDDDIRLKNKGRILFACFCPTCLDLFAKQSGEKVRSQPELARELNKPESGKLRQAWVQFNGRTLESLLLMIKQAVHAVDPKIDIGLMTIAQSVDGSTLQYSGLGNSRASEVLGGKRARPGGGFYDDYSPRQMIAKALNMAEQCEALPARIENVLYEVENFPYQKLSKSVRTVLNECTLALASGCNGIAFNALKDLPGSHEDYDDLFDAIRKEKPFWKALTEACAGLAPAGLWCAYNDKVLVKREVHNEDWFLGSQNYDVGQVYPWAEIGIPLCREQGNSSATLMSGRIAETFSDEELRQILAGGVLVDAETLQVLWKRGLGSLTGVKPGPAYDNGVREIFTKHPLNGAYAGDSRDCRISFWPAQAQEIIPMRDGVESLSQLIGFDDSPRGCCLSIFKNELGGRIVVQSYCPWTLLHSSAKRRQIVELVDWTSRKTIPLRIDRTLRVTPFVRSRKDGQELVAVLLNTAYDPTRKFDLQVRGKFGAISQLSAEGKWTSLESAHEENQLRVTMPNILPWELTVIRATR